jgi:hypothetical protein
MLPQNSKRPVRVEQFRRQAALARCEAYKAHGTEKRRLIAIAKQYELSAGHAEAARAFDADCSRRGLPRRRGYQRRRGRFAPLLPQVLPRRPKPEPLSSYSAITH